MELNVGDRVRTDTGRTATVAVVRGDGRSVFLDFGRDPKVTGLVKHDISKLTKIDPPAKPEMSS